MDNINLNLYKIFYIVAKSKSFVDASNKLFISQPAISKDIKTLENLMNTKLIYRKSNGITLTRDGREFYKYLEQSFGILNTGEQVIKQRNDLSHGTISIGCPSHITSLYLMDHIENFKKDYPNIKIQIISASSEQLIELLQLHKIDFIIDTSSNNGIYNNMEVHKLKSFDSIFISNKEIYFKNIKEMEKQNWILPFGFTNTRKRFDKAFEQQGLTIKSSMELDITDLIINAVKRGLGIGYVIKDSVKEGLKNKTIHEVHTDMDLPKTIIYLINIKGQLTNADKKLIKDYLLK